MNLYRGFTSCRRLQAVPRLVTVGEMVPAAGLRVPDAGPRHDHVTYKSFVWSTVLPQNRSSLEYSERSPCLLLSYFDRRYLRPGTTGPERYVWTTGRRGTLGRPCPLPSRAGNLVSLPSRPSSFVHRTSVTEEAFSRTESPSTPEELPLKTDSRSPFAQPPDRGGGGRGDGVGTFPQSIVTIVNTTELIKFAKCFCLNEFHN